MDEKDWINVKIVVDEIGTIHRRLASSVMISSEENLKKWLEELEEKTNKLKILLK